MAKSANKGASASNTTKSSKSAKGANKATEATPAVVANEGEQQATTAKPKRAPAVEQHGVKRPRAGGLCAAVWEMTEARLPSGKAPAPEDFPTIAEVKASAKEAGLNETNVSIEYYRCRQFHGVRGRSPKVAEVAAQ